MITLTGLTEDNYFLPEDGDIARARFLEMIGKPGELYMSGYGCNMADLFAEFEAQDTAGVKQHLLLDYVQSQADNAKELLKHLNHMQKNTDITLTTAGLNSKRTSQIWHWKAFVKFADDGGEPWCWEGSVNFSDSGWLQGNSCRVFRSQAWADAFIAQFQAHRKWAEDNKPDYQATILQVGESYDFIDAYFDAVKEDLVHPN